MIIELNSTGEPGALGLCGEYKAVQEIKAFRCSARETHFSNYITSLLQGLSQKFIADHCSFLRHYLNYLLLVLFIVEVVCGIYSSHYSLPTVLLLSVSCLNHRHECSYQTQISKRGLSP